MSAVPHGHWKTTTFVAALRHEGLTASVVIVGPMNGPTFLAYPPPYSPGLNPIELAFAKLKSLLRSADGLWQLLSQVLERFPSAKCQRYFAHCGCHATPIWNEN